MFKMNRIGTRTNPLSPISFIAFVWTASRIIVVYMVYRLDGKRCFLALKSNPRFLVAEVAKADTSLF